MLLTEIFLHNYKQINYLNSNDKWKALIELCLGPGLSSMSPLNKSKTLYNHVAIHIFVTITKKKEPVSFWSYYTCYVLLPGTLFEIIQTRNHRYRKKSNVQKIYCDNDFAKTNYDILIHEQSVDCLKLSTPHPWKWRTFQ